MEFTVTPERVCPLGVPGISWRDPKAWFKRRVLCYNLKFWLMRPWGILRKSVSVPTRLENQRRLKKNMGPQKSYNREQEASRVKAPERGLQKSPLVLCNEILPRCSRFSADLCAKAPGQTSKVTRADRLRVPVQDPTAFESPRPALGPPARFLLPL